MLETRRGGRAGQAFTDGEDLELPEDLDIPQAGGGKVAGVGGEDQAHREHDLVMQIMSSAVSAVDPPATSAKVLFHAFV